MTRDDEGSVLVLGIGLTVVVAAMLTVAVMVLVPLSLPGRSGDRVHEPLRIPLWSLVILGSAAMAISVAGIQRSVPVMVARDLTTTDGGRGPRPLTSGYIQLQSESAEAFFRGCKTMQTNEQTQTSIGLCSADHCQGAIGCITVDAGASRRDRHRQRRHGSFGGELRGTRL